MKTVLIIGAVGVGVALLARRLAASRGAFDFEKILERMPDTARPKWMFLNITAIRENTEQILERLEHEKVAEEREPLVV
jgi:hypothetical protein